MIFVLIFIAIKLNSQPVNLAFKFKTYFVIRDNNILIKKDFF